MGKVIDKNDFWFIEKNPITKVGVFPYLGKQISQDCEPNKIYYVLRPKEELFKKETLDSLKLLPLVDEHTMLGKDFTPAEEKGVEGILGEQVVHDTDTIYTDIKIFSEDMKDKISNGKKELSLGYFCTYDKQEGVYKGQRYDYVQKNIVGNHLALVDKGRMGSDVRVYDKAIEVNKVFCCDSLEDIDIEKMAYKKNNEEKKAMTDEKKQVEAIDEDKRKLIDEIGGMLKDKVSEEEWKTIIGKAEKIAYNASEAGKGTDKDEDDDDKKKKDGADKDEDVDKKPAKDKCGKDEDKDKKEDDKDKKDDAKDEDEDDEEAKKKELIKAFAKKEKLAKEVEDALGTFDHSEMTELEIAKYACDKLELDVEEGQEISTLKGYLKGVEKQKVAVTIKAEDSDFQVVEDKSFDNYLKNAKK